MKRLHMIDHQPASSNWYIKFFDAFFITIAAVYLLQSAAIFLPGKEALFYSSLLRVRYKYLLLPAIAGIVYVLAANRQEKKGKLNAEKVHAILLYSSLVGCKLAEPYCFFSEEPRWWASLYCFLF